MCETVPSFLISVCGNDRKLLKILRRIFARNKISNAGRNFSSSIDFQWLEGHILALFLEALCDFFK